MRKKIMDSKKLTREEVRKRLNDATQTKKNLKKSKIDNRSMTNKSLIKYCDETICLCKTLLKYV